MKLVFPRLYAIMDAAFLSRENSRSYQTTSPLAFAKMLADSGVELIQYRDKQGTSRQILQLSRELVAVLRPRGVCLVVNDRPDLAALAGATGVHVGQEDLPFEEARRICGPGRWVGVSTHNLAQVKAAASTSADYVAVGPIFATTTKANTEPVVGIEFIQKARALTDKPLVAIGGITLERAAEVYRAGADSVAVGADLLRAPDPGARARAYLCVTSEREAQ